MEFDKTLFKPGAFDLSGSRPGIYDANVQVSTLLLPDVKLIADFDLSMGTLKDSSVLPSQDLFQRTVAAYNNLLEGEKNLSEDALGYQGQDSAGERQKAFSAEAEKLCGEMKSKASEFEAWLRGLKPEAAREYISNSGECQYPLSTIIANIDYALPLEEETAIIKRESALRARNARLHSELLTSQERDVEILGEKKQAISTLTPNFRHPNSYVRRLVYNTLFGILPNIREASFEQYAAIAESWDYEYVKRRGMKNPIQERNLLNDFPNEAMQMFLDVLKEENEVFKRFWKLKAKLMRQDLLKDGVLQRCDIYAPTSQKISEMEISKGTDFVLSKINEMDPSMAELIYELFQKGHVDRGIRLNKQDGAFSSEHHGHGLLPYLFYGWGGQVTELTTQFHEFFHAIASRLAADKPFIASHLRVLYVEIPSNFGETYGWEKIIETVDDREQKISLMQSEISDMWASIMRQGYFTLFEIMAHEAIGKGANAEDLSQIHLGLLKELFGDSVHVPEMFKDEWIYISHFWNQPFYVPAYAVGNLIALTQYERYTQDHSFLKDIKRTWADANSLSGVDSLRRNGFDPLKESTYRDGFRVIERKVDSLEKMLA
jgi:oligoendopeptidase F